MAKKWSWLHEVCKGETTSRFGVWANPGYGGVVVVDDIAYTITPNSDLLGDGGVITRAANEEFGSD